MKGFAVVAVPVVGLVSLWSIMIRMPGSSHAGPLPRLSRAEASVRDRLRRDLTALATSIGERNVRRADELAHARDWIESELRAAGYEPERQTYDVDGVACANVEVEIRGASRAEEIVVIGAHYDSAVGTPGANDNGSGAVALLALARTFGGRSIGRTLRFVAFVNEEAPHFRTTDMGSRVYSERSRARRENIVAMLSLETIGYYSELPGSQRYPFPMDLIYPDRGNFIAFVGNVASRELVREVVKTFRRTTPFPSEAAALPEHTTGVGWSDHQPFWNAGYPALMVTDTAPFRYPHYHRPTDTPDKIDFERLARVTLGLGRVVQQLVDPPKP